MKIFKSIYPEKINQGEMHRYLLSAIAPRPICFASTIDKKGRVNLSPFSFFNVFSSNPPILIFSPSRRGRDNSIKHTLENVKEVNEVVVNTVNYSMVNQMALSSADFAKGINEFEKAGLTPIQSEFVLPPRVAESPASFECKVKQILPLGEGPGAGNLVIAEVILMHFQQDYLDKENQLITTSMDLVARMGDEWYSRATKDSLFSLPKPTGKLGMGIDNLPEYVRNSSVLTGNDLGELGNLSHLPSQNILEEAQREPRVQELLEKTLPQREIEFHLLAQKIIRNGNPQLGLSILILSEQKK